MFVFNFQSIRLIDYGSLINAWNEFEKYFPRGSNMSSKYKYFILKVFKYKWQILRFWIKTQNSPQYYSLKVSYVFVLVCPNYKWMKQHVDGLVQERSNSIANTLELHLSCTNPSLLPLKFDGIFHCHHLGPIFITDCLPKRHFPVQQWWQFHRDGILFQCIHGLVKQYHYIEMTSSFLFQKLISGVFFIRPFEKRDVLCRGNVRPSVCPSVCPSVRPSVRVFRTFLQHALRYQFETWYMHTVGGTTCRVWVASQLGQFDLVYSQK